MTVGNVIAKVEAELKNQNGSKRELEVISDAVWEDDGWWYVTVRPLNPKMRAYEYADRLTAVEDVLRAHHQQKILLVPALSAD